MKRAALVSAWLAALAALTLAPAARAQPENAAALDKRLTEVERRLEQALRDFKVKDDLASVVIKITEIQSELRDMRRDLDRLRTAIDTNTTYRPGPPGPSSMSLRP